jgi:hypothetical protein
LFSSREFLIQYSDLMPQNHTKNCSLLYMRLARKKKTSAGGISVINMEGRFWRDSCGFCLVSSQEYDECVSALRNSLLRDALKQADVSQRTVRKGSIQSSAMFSAANSIEFRGEIKAVRSAKDIVSFPGKYGPSGWGKAVAAAKDEFLDLSVSCVFLPNQSSLGFGEHAMDPETSACFCVSLYGERKPWGCQWFKEWTENVEVAVALDHKLQVYFFAGQNNEGEVPWSMLAEHGRLCEALLRGLSTEQQIQIRATQQYPFDGLGGSQKGEVAWLNRKGYAYESISVDNFLEDSTFSNLGNVCGTAGEPCVVSMNVTYIHIFLKVMLPLLHAGTKLSSAVVTFTRVSPYFGQHSKPCKCHQQYGRVNEQGCAGFSKWQQNVEAARVLKQELVVLYAEGAVGKGKSRPERIVEESCMRSDFFVRRTQFLEQLPVSEKGRIASAFSPERRDDSNGEEPGCDLTDEEERLFRASLTAEECHFLDEQVGLNYAQKAEVAWLDEQGYEYSEVDVTVWAEEQRARFPFLQDPALVSNQQSRIDNFDYYISRSKANGGYIDTSLPQWKSDWVLAAKGLPV